MQITHVSHQRQHELFQLIDTNNDQKISKEEMSEFLRVLWQKENKLAKERREQEIIDSGDA